MYTAPPDKNKSLKKDVFKAKERELVFDIDMDEYNEIRTCCKGKSIAAVGSGALGGGGAAARVPHLVVGHVLVYLFYYILYYII